MSLKKNSFHKQLMKIETIDETLAILWKIVSKLPKNEITKIKDKYVDQYYQGE